MDGVLLVLARDLAVDEQTIPDNHQKSKKKKTKKNKKKSECLYMIYDISVL
jgi:hypothetical protein